MALPPLGHECAFAQVLGPLLFERYELGRCHFLTILGGDKRENGGRKHPVVFYTRNVIVVGCVDQADLVAAMHNADHVAETFGRLPVVHEAAKDQAQDTRIGA
ncbi:uncharacterized protein SPSK_06742 [Sporothrix schenckii 1099-18]|uniref:Uncharacterized protein n=1 Tax=Sporothrix schenckii 1099-18 TaxID=1397361 RepID=A0A0F2MIB7_SPOSC|nr:uncharacterized protein SPSK_06742 [Sporothrix schenckii 1099-18]KJR89377.1 hypothetical protein SPSK_06742 [Sporothrix schenckii 1099-18]